MRIIALTKGYYTKVSDEDYGMLMKYSWFAKIGGCGGPPYACHTKRIGKRFTTIRMHRLIVNCPDDKEVDHLDGDTLNNQRENLEIVDKQTNLLRRKL